MRARLNVAFILGLLIIPGQCLFGQLTFSGSSRLNDAGYLNSRVKAISDADLFRSLDVQKYAIAEVDKALRRRDTLGAYRAWGTYWKVRKQPRYITDNVELLLDTELLTDYDAFRASLPPGSAEREAIMLAASKLLQNEIRTWGTTTIRFGTTVDFNREVGKTGKYGFHYWWWARPLNSAFILTRDQRYAAKFDELFSQWWEQRNRITRSIPELDVVYYELGLATRSKVFLEYYFMPYDKRPNRSHERMLKTLLGAGRWLYELEEWEGYRSGNWQIHGAMALVQLALAIPEFRESSAWMRIGLTRLQEHLDKDFYDDGGHSERSPRNYTMAVFSTYRNLLYLLQTYGEQKELASSLKSRMGRTVDWWTAMVTPTGEIPAFNDSHRGVVPIRVFQDAARLFGKPEIYQILWNAFRIEAPKGTPRVTPSAPSRNLATSGFATMRSGWSRDALAMTVNYGPYGSSHSHNDILDFELYAYGVCLAADAGIGQTYDDPLHESWYRSSRAHNMVVVNGEDIRREGVQGENVVWFSSPSTDFFSASHGGYRHLGITHRRSIFFVKPEYWLVIDDIASTRDGDTLSWYLHTPSRILPFRTGFQSREAPGLTVLATPKGMSTGVGAGWAASMSDPTPGKTEMIPWVRFDQPSSKDSVQQFAVLLAPFRTAPQAVDLQKRGAGHFAVTSGPFNDEIRFGAVSKNPAGVETDALAVWVRQDRGKVKFTIIEGTVLVYKGKEIWKSAEKASYEGEFYP